ncbi:hypothetical protein CHLNCDRAFT_139199 [Chlorella variabilis]|uniref:O-fucosyltransferase family protein n=1 Tax=Chlorella variabilis TaxID=554065 RepID=E1ZPG2_CHLVA|nr:hypothetical protein CHLNCDRAFT_139199 [Chlorella variabilis]EFN52272.1 hypothetical protein CHLNCDRAFT_139199 [Chlorella variabilis]|eukprot:XP_005844374.1 hypothetical protein CHLNCDRAFT_139199 [Chlorella variabilis]
MVRVSSAWHSCTPRSRLLASLLARLLLLCGAAAASSLGQQGEALGRRAGAGFTAAATAAVRPPGGRGLVLGGRRYRLQLRYTACTGLVNQQYSHIAAFTLAAALGVSDVHLPPAAVRDSFGHKFSVHQEQNQMQWFPARASCLLDVERLQRTWAHQGVAVHEPRTLLPFPDLMFPSGAFILTPVPGLDPRAVVRLHGIYMAGMELSQLVAQVRGAAEAHLARLAAAFPELQLRELLLELPCTFFSLHTASILPVVSQVASTLHFNPALEYLADRVVAYMTRDGRRTFNGAHLRVEKDAMEWISILGGAHTGVALLIGERMCSEVLYKEEYVPPFELQSERRGVGVGVGVPPFELQRLNSEQLALLDFLILARADKHRILHGVPPGRSLLVNASRIGTDEMFARSALVASRRIGSLGIAAAAAAA